MDARATVDRRRGVALIGRRVEHLLRELANVRIGVHFDKRQLHQLDVVGTVLIFLLQTETRWKDVKTGTRRAPQFLPSDDESLERFGVSVGWQFWRWILEYRLELFKEVAMWIGKGAGRDLEEGQTCKDNTNVRELEVIDLQTDSYPNSRHRT